MKTTAKDQLQWLSQVAIDFSKTLPDSVKPVFVNQFNVSVQQIQMDLKAGQEAQDRLAELGEFDDQPSSAVDDESG